mgnify:CR=1 FL=1
MDAKGSGSLGTLIALRLVCCGGPLLVTGVISLGGLLALASQPAAKVGSLGLLVVAIWMIARRFKAAHFSPCPLRAPERGGHS